MHRTVVPELLPISDLRKRQNEILAQLRKGPIVLTQRGRTAGVLVSKEDWNGLVTELEDLRDALDAVEAREELRHNPDSVRALEDIESDLIADGLLDA